MWYEIKLCIWSHRETCKYEITVKWSILFLHYIHCMYVLPRPGNLKSLYWKNIHVVQTKWAVGFRNNSFGCTIIIFESCSSFKHFVCNLGKWGWRVKTGTLTPSFTEQILNDLQLSIWQSLKEIWMVCPFQGNYLNVCIVTKQWYK